MDDPDLPGLARLLSTMIDGLAVQATIAPDDDLADTSSLLARLHKDSGFTLPDGSLVGGEPGSSSA
jgi:hypothetical protein